ncbi:MAG: flagellar biosynthesis repressor FlbT [Roseinatronobacter sp.]
MAGLIIRLAAHERILLNGAVIENGNRRTSFSIKTPNADILRLKDAIHPEQANTPVKRCLFLLQMVISHDVVFDDIRTNLFRSMQDIHELLRDTQSRDTLEAAQDHIAHARFYQALKDLRQLLPGEEAFLARIRK